MFREIFLSLKLAYKNLTSNLARTGLTLVGIVIGITSVIVVSSSGQGVKSFILGQIESFGSDVLQVETKIPSDNRYNSSPSASGMQITTLTLDDAEATLKVPNVKSLYAGSTGQENLNYGNVNKRVLLFGTGSDAPIVDENIKLKEGLFFSEMEDKNLSQVVVIGADVKESFFGQSEALGKEIKIKGKNYKVIGVLEKRGTVGFFNFDSVVYLPIRTLQKKILGVSHIMFFSIKTENAKLVPETVSDITLLLRQRHNSNGPTKDDFIVSSIEEAKEVIGDVFSSINILLLALTSISLIVGGVGIMNVMYISVVERTFEIGLRKALGAKSKNILVQFLLESIFITFLGGIMGIIFGFVLSILISHIFQRMGFDLTFSVTLDSVFLANAFSIATGIIFGFYPAYKASKLSPMEAIRKG